MFQQLKNATLGLCALLVSTVASAAEPAYCDPAVFGTHEVPAPVAGLKRAHLYKLGQVTLVGLAVGDTETSLVEKLAVQVSNKEFDVASRHYCTWYLNKGNSEAADTFVWRYLTDPRKGSAAETSATTYATIQSSFESDAPNWLACLTGASFLAMGCDGQKHRGPGAFGMMLALSGCTPEHALSIVNGIWGLNGVPSATRLAIIRKGYDHGTSHPELRSKLQALFTKFTN